jgi:hypothetical protein
LLSACNPLYLLVIFSGMTSANKLSCLTVHGFGVCPHKKKRNGEKI